MAVVSAEHALPPLAKIPSKEELHYTERWSQNALLHWRHVGDDLADAVSAELAARGDLKDIHNLLETVQRYAETEGGVFKAFMDEVSTPPAWADFARMERGQQMVIRYMHHMYLSLGLGSLVAVGGQFPAMVGVVNATGMLNDADPQANKQRLARTSRFVINLTTPGRINPGQDGWVSILQVRLLHAAVRQYVKDSKRYERKDETPVNQHDLAITLGLFGYINLRNLRRLAVTFPESDEESFMHLWRYVGWVLGIHKDLLPRSVADQQAFFLASTKLVGDDCESCGEQIVNAFAPIPQALSKKTKGVLPASFFEGFHYHLLSLFAGDHYLAGIHKAGGISGRPTPWLISAVQAAGWLNAFVEQYVPLGGRVLNSMNLGLALRTLPSQDNSPHMLRSRL